MIVKDGLVVIMYSLIQMYVLSFEVVQNYPTQLVRNSIHIRLLPHMSRESLLNFCLTSRMQNVCQHNMFDHREKTISIHRRNHIFPFFLPRSSRGISTFSNRIQMLDVDRDINIIYGLPYIKGQVLPTQTSIPMSNKRRTIEMDTGMIPKKSRPESTSRNIYVILTFINALEQLEHKFYGTTYAQLSSISPPDRKVNGISFAISSLFLQITLIALSTEVDPECRSEIDGCTGFHVNEQDKVKTIKDILAWLPVSNDGLTFRHTTRLVLKAGLRVSERFIKGAASAQNIKISYLNGTEDTKILTRKLNKLVESDSAGSMRDTFDEDELSDGVCGVVLSTLCVRARWRAAPTLLNGTMPFRDHERAPRRSARMIRINDVMRYADVTEWDAQALEISYATPGLTFFIIFPRGRSLRNLVAKMSVTSVKNISNRMRTMRIAATLPLYTLRMTLLLPTKLQAMGVNRLIYKSGNDTCDGIKLSHAVQRLMFWSEAGRYAFKDDGLEWDETPQLNIIVDKPYLYYVRWHNVTILNGNFVL